MQNTSDEFLDQAKTLAVSHAESDPKTTDVYYDPTSAQFGEVRLVEVTTDVGAGGDLFAFRYAANPESGLHHKIALVLMHPNDWTLLPPEEPVIPGWSTPEQLRRLDPKDRE
jgi:hypothetical protein